jgi:hypothetical protein
MVFSVSDFIYNLSDFFYILFHILLRNIYLNILFVLKEVSHTVTLLTLHG